MATYVGVRHDATRMELQCETVEIEVDLNTDAPISNVVVWISRFKLLLKLGVKLVGGIVTTFLA